MSSKRASKTGMQEGPVNSDNEPTPLWKRPISWVAGILITAVGAAVTGWVQPIVSDAINSVTESGDPVLVHTERLNNRPGQILWPPDVSLPPDVTLTQADLTSLNKMPTQEQVAWLQDRGGITNGLQPLGLTLKGNRSEAVRITDMQARTECGEVPRGTLVITEEGRGAVSKSVIMNFAISESPGGPQALDPDSLQFKPFFPENTITLQKEEEEYLVVNLVPHSSAYCKVHLQMEVVEDGENHHQRIPEAPETIPVISYEASFKEDYSNVYYGGELCRNYVLMTTESPYSPTDSNFPCGPGNSKKSGNG